MSKNDIISGIYSVGSSVKVIDSNHDYTDFEGQIERIGAAGDLIYYHVRLLGVNTPITFVAKQLTSTEV